MGGTTRCFRPFCFRTGVFSCVFLPTLWVFPPTVQIMFIELNNTHRGIDLPRLTPFVQQKRTFLHTLEGSNEQLAALATAPVEQFSWSRSRKRISNLPVAPQKVHLFLFTRGVKKLQNFINVEVNIKIAGLLCCCVRFIRLTCSGAD